MKRRGLLDAEPAGQVTAPRRTSVRGTPHHLACITAQEAALLRARGGGLTRDGLHRARAASSGLHRRAGGAAAHTRSWEAMQ